MLAAASLSGRSSFSLIQFEPLAVYSFTPALKLLPRETPQWLTSLFQNSNLLWCFCTIWLPGKTPLFEIFHVLASVTSTVSLRAAPWSPVSVLLVLCFSSLPSSPLQLLNFPISAVLLKMMSWSLWEGAKCRGEGRTWCLPLWLKTSLCTSKLSDHVYAKSVLALLVVKWRQYW